MTNSKRYIWQKSVWPNFTYDTGAFEAKARTYFVENASLKGMIYSLSDGRKNEITFDIVVSEIINSFEIEGEHLNIDNVRSSLLFWLGLNKNPSRITDDGTLGIAKVFLSVREEYKTPLSKNLLFKWHEDIIVDKYLKKLGLVGKWRTGPDDMKIVSGPVHKPKVHYVAPPAENVPNEMKLFFDWHNKTELNDFIDPLAGPLKAGIAHIYFECIHPFSDGNGRIGRAISEKALCEALEGPIPFSLSKVILKNRKDYYANLNRAQTGNGDITEWLVFFCDALVNAQIETKLQIDFVLSQTRFWKRYEKSLSARQTRVISRMFEEGREGFEGGIGTRKYSRIAKCSKPTAVRDINALIKLGCLTKLPFGGRSTKYELSLDQLTSPQKV